MTNKDAYWSSVSARLNALYLGLLEWHASLVLSNLRDVKVSLKLHRSPNVQAYARLIHE